MKKGTGLDTGGILLFIWCSHFRRQAHEIMDKNSLKLKITVI
jgi:hypothetical protein